MKNYKVLGIVAGILMSVHVVFYLLYNTHLITRLHQLGIRELLVLMWLFFCLAFATLCFFVIGRLNVMLPLVATILCFLQTLSYHYHEHRWQFSRGIIYDRVFAVSSLLAVLFLWILVTVGKGRIVYLIIGLVFRCIQLYDEIHFVKSYYLRFGFYKYLVLYTNGIWMVLSLMLSAIAVYLSYRYTQHTVVQPGYVAYTSVNYQDMNVVSRFCTNCGKPIVVGATFCGSCGYRVHQ